MNTHLYSGENLKYITIRSLLGNILVAETEKGICALYIGEDIQFLYENLQSSFPNSRITKAEQDSKLKKQAKKIAQMMANPQIHFDIPLDIRGTPFQKRVWKALCKIPLGKTVSYTNIAKKLNMPKAARAVGSACGANEIAIIIPCHRVLKNDGSISGYRWGIEYKQKLLAIEGLAPYVT